MSEYRVQFEVFQGPLDLLLHLVKKQEVDIYQVNLTKIATEFVAYIDAMRSLDIEVAGEFVVMAATLLYIKSRELLPVDQQVVSEDGDEDEDDPRWELIRRLVEYKKFKDAAVQLQERETRMDGIYQRRPGRVEVAPVETNERGSVSVFDLVAAVSAILKRYNERTDVREIQADPYTVSEKIDHLRRMVASRPRFLFSELFSAARSRLEVVVTFLAMLELIRMRVLVCVQSEDFGEIEVQPAPPEAEPGSGTGPVSELPPGAMPPADIVAPVEPTPPGELPDATPLAGGDGPMPA
jgi:segregation and condensation protein A